MIRIVHDCRTSLIDAECHVRSCIDDPYRLADLERRIGKWLDDVGGIAQTCHVEAAVLLFDLVALMRAGKLSVEE